MIVSEVRVTDLIPFESFLVFGSQTRLQYVFSILKKYWICYKSVCCCAMGIFLSFLVPLYNGRARESLPWHLPPFLDYLTVLSSTVPSQLNNGRPEAFRSSPREFTE